MLLEQLSFLKSSLTDVVAIFIAVIIFAAYAALPVVVAVFGCQLLVLLELVQLHVRL